MVLYLCTMQRLRWSDRLPKMSPRRWRKAYLVAPRRREDSSILLRNKELETESGWERQWVAHCFQSPRSIANIHFFVPHTNPGFLLRPTSQSAATSRTFIRMLMVHRLVQRHTQTFVCWRS